MHDQEQLERARERFRRAHGREAEVVARAPGRVNLIGEHTDYNGGLVLPCAIDRDALCLAAPRSDSRVCVVAVDLDERAEFELPVDAVPSGWAGYVAAVFAALGPEAALPGLDLLVTSAVPREAGLSSSAALVVSIATALDRVAGLGQDATGRARLAHRAESEIVGVGCGVLDHFASALGRRDHALRIDCTTERATAVAMPEGRVALLVAHSGVTRALLRGDYRERVAECQSALSALKEAGAVPADAPSLRALTDVPPERFEAHLDPVLRRRVRHVLSENRRVDEVTAALERGDLAAVGRALRAGQASLRDDFEVSIPELDALCEAADALPGVHGSRLTGAGFGGCTVHVVEAAAAADAASELALAFAARFGQRPPVHRVRPWEGAAVVSES